jgi:major membrane immunogen (membrane-anchored lipoprotein)
LLITINNIEKKSNYNKSRIYLLQNALLFGARQFKISFETLIVSSTKKDKTIMSDLLKQAIADAKAVRATALSNAKAALEEHFAPKLQSMLSEKLRAELEGEEEVAPAPAPEAPAPAPAPEAPAPEAELPMDNMGGEEMAAPEAPLPMDDMGGEAAPAPEAPLPTDDMGGEDELSELNIEDDTEYMTEGGKASGDYKKTTKGHNTEDPGKKMVKSVGTAIGGTKGSLPAAKKHEKASSDYTKTTNGHKTDDPQGQGNEVSKGGYDNDTAALKENEEVDETSLDEILKELEDGLNEVGGMDEMDGMGAEEAHAPEFSETGPEKEINLDELLSETDDEDADDENNVEEGKLPADLAAYQAKKAGKSKDDDDDYEEKETVKENISLKKELKDYRSAVVYLRDRINEVNLLNAKLLYTNKLFKQASLNNEQKLKVIESFDLTKSVREAKLVYATLAESFNFGGKKTVVAAPATKRVVSQTVRSITEGLASKPVASTRPTKAAVLTEGAEMANRFKKLAGIRSK